MEHLAEWNIWWSETETIRVFDCWLFRVSSTALGNCNCQYYIHLVGYAFVCLSMNKITQKLHEEFPQSLAEGCGTEMEPINFGANPELDTGIFSFLKNS